MEMRVQTLNRNSERFMEILVFNKLMKIESMFSDKLNLFSEFKSPSLISFLSHTGRTSLSIFHL